MKIYTKKGDKGQTSILGAKRYSKADLRICAIGEVDELNAFIGLIRASTSSKAALLEKIQSDLFTIGAQLAVEEQGKYKTPHIAQADVALLESEIDILEENLPKMTHFILPSGDTTTGYIHVARAVCRRAERTLVALDQVTVLHELLLAYLNRLSDFLFVLARHHTSTHHITEVKWRPNKD